MKSALIVLGLSTVVLGACASTPDGTAGGGARTNTQFAMEGAEQASLTPASGLEVCDPAIVDRRAALADDCLNRIEYAPTTGKQYNAVGREIKHQQPNMCDRMWLPSCRHKY